jgi:hypothetical protein
MEKHPYPGPGARAGAARSSSCPRHCTIARRTPITGNGRGEKQLIARLESPAIAHDELVASAGFVTFDGPRAGFPKESPAAALEVCLSTKIKSVRPAKEHVSSDDHPTHRFYPKQLRFSARDCGTRPMPIA